MTIATGKFYLLKIGNKIDFHINIAQKWNSINLWNIRLMFGMSCVSLRKRIKM